MNIRMAFATIVTAFAGLALCESVLADALSKDDLQFLNKAAQSGHAEVESSKLAQQRAVTSQVKSFANQMVNDHAKAGDELKRLAESKGVKVANEPSIVHKSDLKMLSEAKEAEFDKRFAETFGVKAHEETVKLFKDAAAKASDPDVKAFAQKTLPTLQHHLDMAKQMNAAVQKGDNMSASDKKP
jgi:putative membrane protein